MKKKSLLVLALAVVLVLAFATTASAKYAGYAAAADYLSWGGASQINARIVAAEGGTHQNASPHGGYTQTSVKCVVCHSVHRAFTTATAMGTSTDFKLLNGVGTGACAECHAAWGASPSDTLVAVGETYSGPHIGAGGATCTERGCHGSVHGIGQNTKYAVVAKYNLQNPEAAAESWLATETGQTFGVGSKSDDLALYLDAAIAAGNTNSQISTVATGDAMKAYVTGYVCSPCHNNSSFTVATNGFANPIQLTGDGAETVKTGHPSATGQFYGHAPTCEKCHDLVDVASNSTAFPHANRGIDVYADRYDYDAQGFGEAYDSGVAADLVFDGATTISTDNTVTTRYGLWMTSSISDSTSASIGPIDPVEYSGTSVDGGGGFSLRDGVCLKCHVTDGSLHSLP